MEEKRNPNIMITPDGVEPIIGRPAPKYKTVNHFLELNAVMLEFRKKYNLDPKRDLLPLLKRYTDWIENMGNITLDEI